MKFKKFAVKTSDRLFIPGDIHFPVHDGQLLDLYGRSLSALGVTRSVFIGDTFDSFGLSGHRKAAAARRTRGRIKDEIKAAKPYIKKFTKHGEVDVLTGNHEDWWDDVVEENPALEGFEWWDMYEDALADCTVHPYGTALVAGCLALCHGDELKGSLAKNSAASVLANYPGQNVLYGHTHRVDVCTRPTEKYGKATAHGAWTIGHTRDVEAVQDDKYLRQHAGNWEQGGAVVDFHKANGELRFNVQLFRVFRDGTKPYFVVDGKKYI